MTRLPLFACVALVAALSGCYTMRADLPGTWRPASAHEEVAIVGRIDHETTHWFFLFGLAPAPSSGLYAEPMLLAVREAGGDGVANVKLDTHFTAADVLWRTLTLGVVSPRTYRVRADIVRLPHPPPPGKALLGGARPAPTPIAAPERPSAASSPAEPPAVESVDPSDPPPLLRQP